MAENYTPTGATAAAIERFTSAEAATGTLGTMMRTFHTEIADRTRFLATTGLIAFPATQVASADANTLDDYEEGTWTPTDASGAGLTLTTPTGTYEKIGRLVIARANWTFPATADGSSAIMGGLPFTTANNQSIRQGFVSLSSEATLIRLQVNNAATTINLCTASGAAITNATLTTDSVFLTAIYHV